MSSVETPTPDRSPVDATLATAEEFGRLKRSAGTAELTPGLVAVTRNVTRIQSSNQTQFRLKLNWSLEEIDTCRVCGRARRRRGMDRRETCIAGEAMDTIGRKKLRVVGRRLWR